MKRFFIDHSYDMVKLFLNQIAISIFGFSLALAAGKAESETLRTLTSIFSILFYLFLVYTTAWDIGYRDKVSVDLGKKTMRPLKGALVGLCANFVNYLLAIFIALASIPGIPAAFLSIGGVSQAITVLLEGMYTGVLAIKVGGVALNNFAVVYFLTPLPAILMSALAYYLGLRDIKGTSFFNRQSYPESDRIPTQKKDNRHHD